MNRLAIFGIFFALLISCTARLPRLTPDDSNPVSWERACRAIYPTGEFEVVHQIDATLPGGGRMALLGVTVFSTYRQTLKCTLMTLEGFVLFSAEEDNTIRVFRAVPPFDRQAFGQGMIEDLRFLFFYPKDRAFSIGWSKNNEHTCRYDPDGGSLTDVTLLADGNWNVSRFTRSNSLSRSLESRETASEMAGFPKKIRLKRHGWGGYALDLTLVKAGKR